MPGMERNHVSPEAPPVRPRRSDQLQPLFWTLKPGTADFGVEPPHVISGDVQLASLKCPVDLLGILSNGRKHRRKSDAEAVLVKYLPMGDLDGFVPAAYRVATEYDMANVSTMTRYLQAFMRWGIWRELLRRGDGKMSEE